MTAARRKRGYYTRALFPIVPRCFRRQGRKKRVVAVVASARKKTATTLLPSQTGRALSVYRTTAAGNNRFSACSAGPYFISRCSFVVVFVFYARFARDDYVRTVRAGSNFFSVLYYCGGASMTPPGGAAVFFALRSPASAALGSNPAMGPAPPTGFFSISLMMFVCAERTRIVTNRSRKAQQSQRSPVFAVSIVAAPRGLSVADHVERTCQQR